MKWEKFESGYSVPVKSWCENCEEGAVKQAENLAKHPVVFNHVECNRAMDGIVCERWHKYKGFGKAKGRLDLSEAPQAYKDIESVIDAERDLVEPIVRPSAEITRNTLRKYL